MLLLSNEKRALVRRLARSGRIAWVSTWPADNGLKRHRAAVVSFQLALAGIAEAIRVRGRRQRE